MYTRTVQCAYDPASWVGSHASRAYTCGAYGVLRTLFAAGQTCGTIKRPSVYDNGTYVKSVY